MKKYFSIFLVKATDQRNQMMEDKRRREEEILSGKRSFLYKMKFPEVEDPPKKISIVGMENGYFSLNGLWVPGSVIVFPNRFYMWGVVDAHEIKPHTLDIFKVIKPKPIYLVIGTGKYSVEFPQEFYDYFKEYKIKVEFMPTFEACTHFNMSNEDNLNIAAALIPCNL